jgi:hypothetical protein
MLYHAVSRDITQYRAISRSIAQYRAISRSIAQHHAISRSIAQYHAVSQTTRHLRVADIVCQRRIHSDDDEHVLEMRSHSNRTERQRARLLEHHRHHIVANVPFPRQLKRSR